MASSDDRVVMIGLHFKFQTPDTLHTERRIRLDKNQKTVQIGRTSKRDPNLSSAMNNGWIDSPVISREHAEFFLGDEDQPVYIKDLNSRHGTYLNHERLDPNRSYPVMQGDVVKFGIDIQRDDMTWPPPSAQIFIVTKSPSPPAVTPAQPQRVFVVPDDSDSSDAESEEEDFQEIRHAVKALREVAGARHPRLDSEISQPVPQSAQTEVVHIDISNEEDTASAKVPCVVDLTEPSEIFDPIHSGPVAEQAAMTLSAVDAVQPRIDEVIPKGPSDRSEIHEEVQSSHVKAVGVDMIDLAEDTDVDSEDEDHLDALVDDIFNEEGMVSAGDDSDVMDSDAMDSDAMDSDAVDSDEEESDDMVLWDESEPSSPSPNLMPLYADVVNGHAIPKANLEEFGARENDSKMDTENVEVKEVATETFGLTQGSFNGTEVAAQRIPRFISTESANDWPASSDSMPFHSSQLTALPGCRYLQDAGYAHAAEPDYRLRLPSILNNPPRQASVSAVESYIRSSSSQPEVPRSSVEREVAPESTQTAERVEEETADLTMEVLTAQEPAAKSEAPIIAQLVPQSPLIESGDRFLAYPLEETDEPKDRDSPELDMSSAWLFQQSKLNNTTKTTIAAAPADELASDKAPESSPRAGTKRKADEISGLTEAEEAQKAIAPDMILISQKARVSHEPSVEPSACLPAKHDDAHAPKKMRRMAEAARLLALGGAAAGVALFTTLVATAPSFT